MSQTALGSAYWRAGHLRVDPPPWILEDNVAQRLLGPALLDELAGPVATWSEEQRASFRLLSVVRARLVEDLAVERLASGHNHYAILGAGLDTFAWRHPDANRFTIWEYDLPATQTWKREAIAAAGLEEPDNVRFVPLDLASEQLDSVERPLDATWSWMGVTMYLPTDAIRQVLGALRRCGQGTALAVHFLLPVAERQPAGVHVSLPAAQLVSDSGEPVVTHHGRDEINEMLRVAGFGDVELLDAQALAARFCAGRPYRLPSQTLIAVARA